MIRRPETIRPLARFILYVNGTKWGSYLTKEDAEEVASRRKRQGQKVKITYAVDGWVDA